MFKYKQYNSSFSFLYFVHLQDMWIRKLNCCHHGAHNFSMSNSMCHSAADKIKVICRMNMEKYSLADLREGSTQFKEEI